MARKMTLKFCPACGRDFRSRRSLVRHIDGYTRKYGKEKVVFDPCTGPKPERAPVTFVLPLDAYYPNAINIGKAIPSDHPFTCDPTIPKEQRDAA